MNSPTTRTTTRARIGATVAAAAVVAGGIGLATPAVANAATVTKTITIDAKTAGADNVFAQSGVTVAAGSTVSVTATGSATFDPNYTTEVAGPNGYPEITCTDQPQSTCVLSGSPQMALVGKVGTAAPVVVGTGPTTLSGSGPLSFAFNDQIDGFANNEGSFTVTITYTPPCTGIFCFGS
ncbi:hypothetical protein [Williamsia sp.]|uniref:hypothetical protein n=1 Tax=Williamsia sp. TaxID=1872085 RepID=UPI001A1DA665|nr:hypothetical protein [Williamsia sp.]MBJ7291549.1 hypothetical protein [Williamsia sp.]